jgi:cytoskeletal protein CcmA (bactofilin family)
MVFGNGKAKAKAKAKADESRADRVVAAAQEEIRNLAKGNDQSDRVVAAQEENHRLMGAPRDRDARHPEAASSISSGISIVGKIVVRGAVTIFGHVDGELQASIVVIAQGAEMVGDVVAEELTVNGHVKGNIHANRVKLGGTAVVEGDIFHRTLAIEENALFEGASRRNENAIDAQSLVQINRSQTQAASIGSNDKGNGVSDSLSS